MRTLQFYLVLLLLSPVQPQARLEVSGAVCMFVMVIGTGRNRKLRIFFCLLNGFFKIKLKNSQGGRKWKEDLRNENVMCLCWLVEYW